LLRDRHSFPTRRSSDLDIPEFTGILKAYRSLMLLFVFLLYQMQEKTGFIQDTLVRIGGFHHDGICVFLDSAFFALRQVFTGENRSEDPRLNSSHVKISY